MKEPNLWIKLRPYSGEGFQPAYFDAEFVLQGLVIEEGQSAAELWQTIVGLPGAVLGEEGLRAFDEEGALPLEMTVEKDVTGFDKRVWRVQRTTRGDVKLQYRFFPRDLTDVHRAHPLFDVCNEPGGCTGSGVTSLAAVPQGTYHIHMEWDLRDMPAGTEAMFLKNDFTGTPDQYVFSLYALGDLKSAAGKTGLQRIWWLSEPLPDAENLTGQLPAMLEGICSFFGDGHIPYGMILRKDPFDLSNSGTAFDGGFMYGYSDAMPVSFENSWNTLAHEIVHNWTHMDAEGGQAGWFVEGMAEYYSLVLPYRLGLVTPEEIAEQMTEKTFNYYSNEFLHSSNEEAARFTWENRDAQRIPYGRGFCYLLETDRKLREKSGGRENLDDVILPLVEKHRRGEQVTEEDWTAAVTEKLGAEEAEFFRGVMAAETTIEPSDAWLGGAFTFTKGRFGTVKTKTVDDAVIWRVKDGIEHVRF